MDKAIELALRTWYDKDHPLHLDPLHPVIGLAGEAGELLDLYKKERFKAGTSWWDCICGHTEHNQKMCNTEMNNPNLWSSDDMYPSNDIWCTCEVYTPKILDELGDLWYYLRILAYQRDQNLSEWILSKKQDTYDNMTILLIDLNYNSALLLLILSGDNKIKLNNLEIVFGWFQRILPILDTTLDQLTELNWQKLKDSDNHGWKKARSSNTY